jgi:hypothetical protein
MTFRSDHLASSHPHLKRSTGRLASTEPRNQRHRYDAHSKLFPSRHQGFFSGEASFFKYVNAGTKISLVESLDCKCYARGMLYSTLTLEMKNCLFVDTNLLGEGEDIRVVSHLRSLPQIHDHSTVKIRRIYGSSVSNSSFFPPQRRILHDVCIYKNGGLAQSCYLAFGLRPIQYHCIVLYYQNYVSPLAGR